MSKNSGPRKLKSAKKSKIIDQPYNHYDLYFILEHKLLLQSKGLITDFLKDALAKSSSRFIRLAKSDGYWDLDLPPMPPRFNAAVLPSDWFVHGKNDKTKKRVHTKTHGCTSFVEIAKKNRQIGSKLVRRRLIEPSFLSCVMIFSTIFSHCHLLIVMSLDSKRNQCKQHCIP